MPWVIFVICFASLWAIPIRAVESNTTYNTTAPGSNVPYWGTGWGNSSVSGWDYVGNIGGTKNANGIFTNGASGTYLGYGWVLTAAHVGPGTFNIVDGPGAGTYYVVIGSGHPITDANGTADLYLFQVSNPPNLPPLIISTTLPTPSDNVAMLGFGGSYGLTWGLTTVTYINQLITPQNYSYVSNDFFCNYDSTVTNGMYNSRVVGGDSGGGTFIYNTTSGKWELTGINEVSGTYQGVTNPTFSGMVQLDTYATQINNIVNPPGVSGPTMPLPALLLMGCLLFGAASRTLGRKPVER